MSTQLTLLPTTLPASLNEVKIPPGHPLDQEFHELATSPVVVDGKDHGFMWLLDQHKRLKRRFLVEKMTRGQVVAYYNNAHSEGHGAQIKWDAGLQEYTTTTGDRFAGNAVEERVAELLEID
jgi:hypothetical protein